MKPNALPTGYQQQPPPASMQQYYMGPVNQQFSINGGIQQQQQPEQQHSVFPGVRPSNGYAQHPGHPLGALMHRMRRSQSFGAPGAAYGFNPKLQELQGALAQSRSLTVQRVQTVLRRQRQYDNLYNALPLWSDAQQLLQWQTSQQGRDAATRVQLLHASSAFAPQVASSYPSGAFGMPQHPAHAVFELQGALQRRNKNESAASS